MHIIYELIVFLVKLSAILFGIILIIKVILSAKGSGKKDGLKVKHLNHEHRESTRWLEAELLTPALRAAKLKAQSGEQKRKDKADKKEAKRALKKGKLNEERKKNQDDSEDTISTRPRMFVLDFKGDIQASGLESLRKEISSILDVYREGDTVTLRLHNSGGYVHTHGLAASQLVRLKTHGVPLTITIDQVAASGGYMMACVGERIIAAPFAVIGSIGVVAQMPNINKLLSNYGIEVESHTAGRYKRTLTFMGENTEEGREKFKQDLAETHDLFKDFVLARRPSLEIDKIATGEVWYGQRALDVGLIDSIQTSDDFLRDSFEHYEVYSLSYERSPALRERLLLAAHSMINGRLPEL